MDTDGDGGGRDGVERGGRDRVADSESTALDWILRVPSLSFW